MLSLTSPTRMTPHRGDRYVEAGRVSCPRQGTDIDVERCLSCPWLRRAGLSRAPAWIRCSPPADLGLPPFAGMLTTGRERS
jgi:hypothetical protein